MHETLIEFVERMGLLGASDGMPRIAGRLFGYILISPDPLSLDDLAAGLGVSKASVSNDARRLADAGIIELVSRPGDRRDYYRIAPDSFASAMRRKISHVREFHAVLTAVQGLHDVVSPEVRERLEEYEAGTREMTNVLETTLARWQAHAASTAALSNGER